MRFRRAFTLIELLVVTAVVMALVSILTFSVQGAYSYAMRLKCQHRMEQVSYACTMYHNENRGKFPQAWDFDVRTPWYVNLYTEGYLDRDDALGCPLSEADPVVDPDEAAGGGGGGSPPEQDVEAINMGIRWLAANAHVTKDELPPERWRDGGGWDPWGAMHQLRFRDGDEYWWGNRPVRGVGSGTVNYATNGVVIQAFLNFGVTPEDPDYGHLLRGAIKELVVGHYLWGPYTCYINTEYTQSETAIALMGLVKAYAMLGEMDFHCAFDEYFGVESLPGHRRSLKTACEVILDWGHDHANATMGGLPYDYVSDGSSTQANTWWWWAIAAALDTDLDVQNFPTHAETYLNSTMTSDGGPVAKRFYGDVPASGGGSIEFGPPNLSVRLQRRGLDADALTQVNWHIAGDLYLDMAAWGSSTSMTYVYFMTEALSMVGGTAWDEWCAVAFPALVDQGIREDGGGEERMYWPSNLTTQAFPTSQDSFITALACMTMEKITDVPGTPDEPAGYLVDPYSFGYNRLLGLNRRTPAADTIVVMDYLLWGIRAADPLSRIAPRHGDRVNILFADGHVETLSQDDIRDGMWTPEPGD